MLRPLILDILSLLLPLSVGSLAFVLGRVLRRMPKVLRVLIVAFAIGLVICGGASLLHLLPDFVDSAFSYAGGATVVLSCVALLLVGAGWSTPGGSLSSSFLAILVVVAGCLIVIESSGRLWWRYCADDQWRRFPDRQGNLQQSSSLTCSPTAAAMLLDRYSINASEGEMAYRAATSFLGTDAHSMVRALREKVSENGYQVRTRRVDYEECIRRGEPFLAHVRGANFGHAVLVERVSSEMATIVDPVDGLLHRLPRKEFEGIWDGTVIEIVPSAE